jgi:hypothetical protein
MKYNLYGYIICYLILLNSGLAQWASSVLPSPGIITDIKCISNENAFVQQFYTYFPNPQTSATTMKFYKSTDNGSTWNSKFTYVGQPYENWGCSKISFLNSTTGIFVFQNYSGNQLYKTTNTGESWTNNFIPFSSGYNVVSCAFINDSTILVLMNYQGSGYQIFRSSNSGLNWSNLIPPTNDNLTKVYFTNQNLGFITAFNGIIYKSIDLGLSWQVINTGTSTNYYDISFSDNLNGYATGYGYSPQSQSIIVKTSNGGFNWTVCYLFYNNFLKSISSPIPNITYASGLNLIKTINSGENWNPLLAFNITSYVSCFNKDSILVASGDTVFRTFNGGIIYIRNLKESFPDKYSLSQNYPNPFNPITKIKFDIPTLNKGGRGGVSMKVYDLLGKEIQILVNEELNPGTYEVTFDGTNLPSGIYFYQLRCGEFVQTRKLVLLK